MEKELRIKRIERKVTDVLTEFFVAVEENILDNDDDELTARLIIAENVAEDVMSACVKLGIPLKDSWKRFTKDVQDNILLTNT